MKTPKSSTASTPTFNTNRSKPKKSSSGETALQWGLLPIGAVDLLVEIQDDFLPTRLTVRVLEGARQADAAADVSAIGAEDAAATPPSASSGLPPIEIAQAQPAGTAPGGSSASDAPAASAGASASSGAMALPANFIPFAALLGGATLIATRDSASAPAPAAAATVTGKVIDGYLSGATVFIDRNKNNQLDADEPSTKSDAEGNFTLPKGVDGPVVSIGGRDITTNLEFTGVLKAPAGSTAVTPLTTLVSELMTSKSLSAAAAQEQVLDAVGLGSLKGKVDLTTLDPVAATKAGTAGALDIQKAGVAVATMVSSLAVKVQQTAGVAADKHDEIAGGIFLELAKSIGAGKLAPDKIADTASAVVNTLATQASVGGVVVNGTNLKAASVSAIENLAGLTARLAAAQTLDALASDQKSALTQTTYTLQLLHFADAEAGMLAPMTAPKLAAMVDRFEDAYPNSITLAGGDNFLPGPFLAAGTDDSIRSVFNSVTGSTVTGTMPIAAVDIALHNLIGVQASTVGNHEFDLGSNVLVGAFGGGSGFAGAQFPYLSANLDVSGDSALSGRFTDTVKAAGLEEASSVKGRLVPSAVITEGGAKIGLVGATTQLLESISSPSGTKVRDNDSVRSDDMDLLASQLQPVIDDLSSQGVNKIVLMAHLQSLANEKLLATKLSGVDIILAAGSNTRLGDANDKAVEFAGHPATFADTYPLVIKDKEGRNTLVVNTDNEFTYLGRLVVDFDANGHIVPASLTANTAINGAYAATDANVAAAWGTTVGQLSSTAFAQGTRGGQVKALTDAVQSVITVKDGVVYGYSDVYLEGERIAVRNQETNLGNLTADANAYALQRALGNGAAAQTYVVSLKNGGGIRAQIGTISAPKADGTVDKLPPEGGVSQLDVENSLRFNNQLMAFDTTPAGLKAILEHGVAVLGSQGRFPQIGGVSFSYDPDPQAGSRVSDIALVGDGYRVNLYNDGKLLADAPAKITVVTLNFLANDGDLYPIKANGSNFRYLVEQPGGAMALTGPVDKSLNFTAAATITGAIGSSTLLGEQKALEVYMKAFHATPQSAYKQADTAAQLDLRIQDLNVRSEAVLNTAVSGAKLLNASIDGLGDAITLYFDRALDSTNLPALSQFSVLGSGGVGAVAVTGVQVFDYQVRLRLGSALAAGATAEVAFRDPTPGNDVATLQARDGTDVLDIRGFGISNRLSLQPSGAVNFEQAATVNLAGAEISAFDPASKRLFVTSAAGLQVLSVDQDLKMTLLGTITLGSNDINSVAVGKGLVAVAVAAADKTQPGSVFFLDADAPLTVTGGAIAAQGFVLGSVTVGALPDMLTFTADGSKVLVANEGEQNDVDGLDANDNTIPIPALVNPEGSVSIIDLANGVAGATVKTASFSAFNAKLAELKAAGVRLFAGESGFEAITVAQDLEPEYIAIAPDGRTAFVTLQENNALAILDIASGQFTDIVPLGRKSFLGLPFDGSDRDGASNANSVSLSTERPVFGQYMPDSIASFTGADGRVYYLIANEGDDRDDFIAPNETIRVSDSGYDLDNTVFPNETALKTNAQIGRLTVSNAPGNRGDTDGDGDIDQILTYGARSFSIVDAQGRVVFDSGSQIEQFVAAGGVFSSSSPATSGLFDDTRSDNKGPEPEGITVGRVGDRTLAFVGLERGGGGVMVYDVTNPAQVSFMQYLRNPADVSPEGLTFVAAHDSPSGRNALFVANEVSNTVTVFQNAAPKLSFNQPPGGVDLASYQLTGRFALPAQPTAANKLAHEASAITYNRDTDSLFVVGDGGTAIAQVTKQGVLVDSMALAAGSSPQGTYFYDTEGIAYLGNSRFAMVEERDRKLNEFTYQAGTTLGPTSAVRSVKMGTSIGNIGLEGLSLDPATGGFLFAKEATPMGVFQSTVNFAAGTASNGSATTVNAENLFDTAKTGLTSVNDIFALSNVLQASAADYNSFLLISAADGKLLKMDRQGRIEGSLNFSAAAKNEGVTMDGAGNIYIVGEEGGGSIDRPEMLVYSPTREVSSVAPGANLYLTFDRAVVAGSGNIVLKDTGGDIRTIAVSDATQVSFVGSVVTLNPALPLNSGSTYTISYDAGVFKGSDNAAIGGVAAGMLAFKTSGDLLAPRLVSTSPINGAAGITSHHTILTFDEPVKAGSGNIILSGVNSGGLKDMRSIPVGDVTQVTISGTTVDINPSADLRNGYTYTVSVGAGVLTDLAGNAYPGFTMPNALSYTRNLGTVTGPQTVVITEVNSNAGTDFFELYNYGSESVSLDGWKWDDDSASFTDAAAASFPAGTVIASGARLVVAASTDAAAFRSAWGLAADVPVVATGGPGLGMGDTVVIFNQAAQAVTAFNYGITSKTASDGTVLPVAATAPGATAATAASHAGAAFGGTASVSAVWDGVSVSSPAYKPAVVGQLGAFAQPAAATNIGSPGLIAAPQSADVTAPTLSSSLPVESSLSALSTTNIVLSFSEAVKAGTGNVQIVNTADATDTRTIAVTDTSQIGFAAGVVTINPSANLKPGASYSVQMAAGVIEDVAGNDFAGLLGEQSIGFSVAAQTPQLIVTELNSNAGPADFFELYNFGSSAISLKGWRWDDDSASFAEGAAFPDVSIPAGKALVVAATAATGLDAFKSTWSLAAGVSAITSEGPGLGSGDAVVIFNDAGSVITSFNYSGTAKVATDGSTVATSKAAAGVSFAAGRHAGPAFGGTGNGVSAVWDGQSTNDPSYLAAVVGSLDGYAQAGNVANIGSPGFIPGVMPV